MNRLASNYVRHHYLGRDCRITALRNILAYFGDAYSYAVVSGLSATHGFIYQRTAFNFFELLLAPDCDCTQHMHVITGNHLDCIGGLATTFNATLFRSRGEDEQKTFEQIAEFLEQEIPVMVAVCRQYLNNQIGRGSEYGSPAGAIAFGSHWVVLAGRDREAGKVILFDSDMEQPLLVREEIFRQARTWGDNATNYYHKSRAGWAACIPATRNPEPQRMVRDVMARISFRMHAQSSFRAGRSDLESLQEFVTEIPKLHISETMPMEKLCATIRMLRFQGQYITGGGLSRRIFASFLRYAAKVMQSDLLIDAAAQCVTLSHCWDDLIDLLSYEVLENATTDLGRIAGLRARLQELLERETALVYQFDRFICEG